MNEPIHLSNQQARHFLLAKHCLWPPRALRGKEGVLTVFDRLACIQFDPLNIVARNADLVLQSRVADYQPEMLYELAYGSRQLYDYWDKMMAYLRMRDWPMFALPRARWRQHHSRRLEDFGEYVEFMLVGAGYGAGAGLTPVFETESTPYGISVEIPIDGSFGMAVLGAAIKAVEGNTEFPVETTIEFTLAEAEEEEEEE